MAAFAPGRLSIASLESPHGPADTQTGALAARLAGIRAQLETVESALRAAPEVPGARRPE